MLETRGQRLSMSRVPDDTRTNFTLSWQLWSLELFFPFVLVQHNFILCNLYTFAVLVF